MPLFAIAAVSAAVLGYEVLLVRLFAIVQWHHFAYMAISIALLGFGASGTLIAVARDWLRARFFPTFVAGAALFGVLAPAAFALAQRLPFNALAIAWDSGELFYLPAFYALLAAPFVCGATCIGLAFVRYPDAIGRIYRWNLVGSGVGALGIVAALFLLTPSDALGLVGGLGLAAAATGCLARPEARYRGAAAVLALLAVALPVALPAAWTAPRFSEYKGLSRALLVPGAEVVAERSSPLAHLAVVRSPTIPFRHAPGLSLAAPGEPAAQLGVFADGDGLSVITAFDGETEPLAYLDYTTAALPYHLRTRPRVLVLGAGGGADVLQALVHDAAHVDAVELDGEMAALVGDRFSDFAGNLYGRPEVAPRVAEARGFVARGGERWDLIQIPLLDSFGAAAAGVHSLSENYIYTVEAFRLYLHRLAPGGILAITRWLKLPPRDSLKLFLTALTALEAEGVEGPGERLALIRGWNTTTLLVRDGAFEAGELVTIREFARARAFDLAYLPGLAPEEVNRANILDAPYFYAGATALAGAERAAFLAGYKFDLAPATDNRPYFFDFFRWRAMPELLRLRALGGAGLIEWGYPILFATLLQAAALSAVLILAPLWARSRSAAPAGARRRVALYFLLLGLAFLFVEIAFIQRFTLFLGHPLYAVAVVLSAFLVFAGMGSGAAPRLAERLEARPGGRVSAIGLAVAGIAGIALLYLAFLPVLLAPLIALAEPFRVALALTLIAPLAFCMGMPFPLGLARVALAAPDLVPWAWGINGCASVLSAVLATILAIHLGFAAVVAIAAVLYGLAALAFRRPLVAETGPRR